MNSILAKNVELPQETQAEDFMIMHETGAYTMSMYSIFNSIIPSPVYGFSLKSGIRIWCFKERETLDECTAFQGSNHCRFIWIKFQFFVQKLNFVDERNENKNEI